MSKEKILFKQLSKFKDENFDEELLCGATPYVLGMLFFNRMQGVAYGVLEKNGFLGKINREFRNSLKSAYEQNIQKNESFFKCVALVSDILSGCECKVAMLKGALLCLQYPNGYRTSNDIDLLVAPENVTVVGELLTKSGFKQGNIRNGEFVPATRKEIIESKMTRGETVPFIKEMNLPYMKYLEVDINFSLDYKNSDATALNEMLERRVIVTERNISIPTLSASDFFIHLCAHLYKEATTLPWIEMHRDMTLYKYCDIYMLLSELSEDEIRTIFKRAEEFGIHEACAFAILQTAELFDISNSVAIDISKEILANNPQLLLSVISPKDKKIMVYKTTDVVERFFMNNRAEDLTEVKKDEKN